MSFPNNLDEYMTKMDTYGDIILDWADPENKFRGYTEVRHSDRYIVDVTSPEITYVPHSVLRDGP